MGKLILFFALCRRCALLFFSFRTVVVGLLLWIGRVWKYNKKLLVFVKRHWEDDDNVLLLTWRKRRKMRRRKWFRELKKILLTFTTLFVRAKTKTKHQQTITRRTVDRYNILRMVRWQHYVVLMDIWLDYMNPLLLMLTTKVLIQLTDWYWILLTDTIDLIIDGE